MTRTAHLLAVFALLFATAGRARADEDLRALAGRAVDGGAAAQAAIASLRARGPAGLDALFAVHAAGLIAARDAATPDLAQRRLLDAIDAVAAQRLAAWSRLFWHTDMAAARAEASALGRPILSLRLLGRLDEDLSCANSRFFRVLLYANQDVARELRESFVLHWQSVRPAPRLTVDFGDGRTLVRTVTGNSIHYVLDAEGGVIDALPGLYAPRAFLRALRDAGRMATAVQHAPARAGALLRAYHAERIGAGGPGPAGTGALRADRVALTKSAVERPLVRALTGHAAAPADDDAATERLAAAYAMDAELDAASLGLVRRSLPAPAADRILGRLRRDLARDTARNETQLHSRIHAWLAKAGDRRVEPFNERVYAELFLTPSSDPWLGLVADDAYTALELPR